MLTDVMLSGVMLTVVAPVAECIIAKHTLEGSNLGEKSEKNKIYLTFI